MILRNEKFMGTCINLYTVTFIKRLNDSRNEIERIIRHSPDFYLSL